MEVIWIKSKFLLQNGADVNAVLIDRWTPLHWALQEDDLESVNLMIKYGADLDVEDDNGMTPLHWAFQNDNLEEALWLIESGAEVYAQDRFGSTSLHHASSKDNLEGAKLMIEYGADLDIEDDYGMTQLHSACCSVNFEFVKLLVENGANLNVKDDTGSTPLHHVCRSWFGSSHVRKFQSRFQSKRFKYDETEMQIHRLPLPDHFKVVHLLLSRGVDVKVESDEGETPLHVAAEGNHADLVYFLVRQRPWLVAGSL